MTEEEVDWSKCEDVESVPRRLSGAWVVKGSRVQAHSRRGRRGRRRGQARNRAPAEAGSAGRARRSCGRARAEIALQLPQPQNKDSVHRRPRHT
jgi:hypothetical protein